MFLNQASVAIKYNQFINFSMKTKSVSAKLCDSYKFPTQTHLDQSLLHTFSPQIKKNSTIKITSSPSSPKSLSISKKILATPTKKSFKKASELLKSIKILKNLKKSEKKKLIKKDPKITIKPVSNPRKTDSSTKKDPKIQTQPNPVRNKKENTINLSNKQNIETKTNQNVSQHDQTQQIEQRPVKPSQPQFLEFKLEESIQIRLMSYQRGQLQKKREDLLKRNVEDWEMVNKGRSTYRELRNLGN